MVGTAQARLCPPYNFGRMVLDRYSALLTSLIRGAVASVMLR